MHIFVLFDLQVVGGKVVLHRRVHLHYVASLPPHIEVVDASVVHLVGPRHQLKHVTPVLEHSAVLSCVDGQTQHGLLVHHLHVGVLLHGGNLWA